MISLPVCTTLAECERHDGERVEVVGTYTVWDPLPYRSRRHRPPQQVMLVFESGEDNGVYLEAWGHAGHMRDLEEIARFRGQRVRVTGTFRRKMPPHPTDPPHATSLAGPCLHPVETITSA